MDEKFYTIKHLLNYKGMYLQKINNIIKDSGVQRQKKKVDGQLIYVFSEADFKKIMDCAGFVETEKGWVLLGERS